MLETYGLPLQVTTNDDVGVVITPFEFLTLQDPSLESAIFTEFRALYAFLYPEIEFTTPEQLSRFIVQTFESWDPQQLETEPFIIVKKQDNQYIIMLTGHNRTLQLLMQVSNLAAGSESLVNRRLAFFGEGDSSIENIAKGFLVGRVMSAVQACISHDSPLYKEIFKLSEGDGDLIKLFKKVIHLLQTHTLDAEIQNMIENPPDTYSAMLASELLKYYHQVGGAGIVSMENPNRTQSIELITNLIDITDIIDTATDSTKSFLSLDPASQSTVREHLLQSYVNIFDHKNTVPNPISISNLPEDIIDLITAISEKCSQARHLLDNLLKGNPNQQAIKQSLYLEASRYSNAITVMDSIDAQTEISTDTFIDDVASKSSNLSLLGLIDFAVTYPDLCTLESMQRFVEAIRKFHLPHIAEDGLVDIEMDLRSGVPNIWTIESEATKDPLATSLANRVAGSQTEGMAILNSMGLQNLSAHWLHVSLARMELYARQFLNSDNVPGSIAMGNAYFQKAIATLDTIPLAA